MEKITEFKKAYLLLLAVCAFVCANTTVVLAESNSLPVSTGVFHDKAINKNDVVSYRSANKAVQGVKMFVHVWQGTEFYFVSEEQRDMFAEEPTKFIPMYNGFCSNALILDEGLIRTSGKVWHIFEGNLHLFFAQRGLDRWLQGDYHALKTQADKAWESEVALWRN